VPEEGLHRRVVPAVPPARHRLGDARVREEFDVGVRGVMASLVGMDEDRLREPFRRVEPPEHLDDELEPERLRQRPGDDLVGGRVLQGGEEAKPLQMRAVMDVADVGQEMLSGPPDGELAVELVRERRVGLDRFCYLLERVRPPRRAFEPVFPHEPFHLLPVHRDAEEPRHHHRYRPRPLGPALVSEGLLDQQEIGVVARLAGGRGGAFLPRGVGVVAGPGDARLAAHPRYVEPERPRVFLSGPVYDL